MNVYLVMKKPALFLWMIATWLVVVQCGAQQKQFAEGRSLTGHYQVYGYTAHDSNIFAATGVGILKSTDQGLNWTPANTGLDTLNVLSVAAHDSLLFAGTQGGKGLYRSTDNGVSWTAADAGIMENDGITVKSVTTLGVKGTSVFAGTWVGLYKSSDDGGSWTTADSGLAGWTTGFSVMDTLLFAVTDEGIFRSSDDGAHWNQLIFHTSMLSVLTVGQVLYAGTWGSGVLLSTDAGNSWTTADSGLSLIEGASYIRSLVQSGDNLLAGTWDAGIYLSSDQGLHWQCSDTAMAAHVTMCTLYSRGDGLVLAGTSMGQYRSTDHGITWGSLITSVNPSEPALASGYLLDQNYPNPFNPTTTIRYGLPYQSHVKLTIFTTLGQEVATLVDSDEGTGYHTVQFDGANLSSGTYFYCMRVRPVAKPQGPDSRSSADYFVQTKRLVLIR